jgi:hypothetical protein
MPSPEEFASTRNIKINPDVEKNSKLGQIGKKSDLEADDVDMNGIGGDGNFLWSL